MKSFSKTLLVEHALNSQIHDALQSDRAGCVQEDGKSLPGIVLPRWPPDLLNSQSAGGTGPTRGNTATR